MNKFEFKVRDLRKLILSIPTACDDYLVDWLNYEGDKNIPQISISVPVDFLIKEKECGCDSNRK